MAVQVSYPGVYIDEFAPGAPIQGVGTNTAAFIGPAAQGEIDRPTKITTWDRFRALYGQQPMPGTVLWYAVRGFFENGGQVCYIVRASNGEYAGVGLGVAGHDPLVNRANQAMLRVRTTRPGALTQQMQIAVSDAHVLPDTATELYRPTGNYRVVGPRELTLTNAAEAARFRPGDFVNLDAANPRVQITRVTGDTLRLGSDFVGAPPAAAAAMALADIPAGTQAVRINWTNAAQPIPANALGPGTILTLTQTTGVAPNDVTVSDSQVVDTVEAEVTPALTTWRVTLRAGLRAAFSMGTAVRVQSEEFTLAVTHGTQTTYPNLSVEPLHPRYFGTIVNAPGGLVHVEMLEPAPAALPPRNLPLAATVNVVVGNGGNETLPLPDQAYVDAIAALAAVDDVNLVAIPDSQSTVVQQALIAHCEQTADRFAVLDAPAGLELFGQTGSVEAHRRAVDSTRGYAALYYPWLRVASPRPGPLVLVPPSGHVCGVIARSDGARGVHKAPANEIVNGALDVERPMSDVDQGQLNLQNINVIRVFQQGGRPMLWGARTTATDRNWQYVNIRRLFLFLEESIQEGIRWAVFEPNNLALWAKLRRSIGAFLLQQWRDGALFGATAEEAFYVRIDEALNPDNERALGRLTIEIGVRPSYPAEFIIVRIGIWQGGSDVTEG